METNKKGASGKVFWSDTEKAFILNYADVCLQQQQDYKATVVEEFTKIANRDVTINAINKKWRALLVVYSTDKSGVTKTYIDDGTRHLNIGTLPPNLLIEMNAQRQRLGLEELSAAGSPGSHASLGAAEGSSSQQVSVSSPKFRDLSELTSQTSNSRKRKVTTDDSRNSRKTYREMTVTDSDTPYGKEQEDATDDEYAARPTNKKRKTGHFVSGPSSQQQRKTAAPTTSKVSRRQTAPQELQMETKPAPSRKRKAAPAEVIDNRNAAPPPPKRQATMMHMTARTPATGEGQATRHQPKSEAHVTHGQNVPLQSQETLPSQPPKMHPSKLPSRLQDLHPVRVQPSGEIDPSTTAEDLIARGMVKDLAQVVGILLRDQAKSDIGLSDEVRARLQTVQRTVQFDPGQLLEKMLEDLHAADSIRADHVALFKGLVGDKQSRGKNEFPRVLNTYEIGDSWRKLRTRVSDAFGVATNCTQPMPDHVDNWLYCSTHPGPCKRRSQPSR
jgi:hypothetical protein